MNPAQKNSSRKPSELLDFLGTRGLDDRQALQESLFDFITNFSTWESSTDPKLEATARKLVAPAYFGDTPLVVDPFSGIGSIPYEALRVGADSFAGDLNPVATIVTKISSEFIPKYGLKLGDEVKKWGHWCLERVKKDVEEYYPSDYDRSIPMAYLWARTIRCEGPGCGATVPLLGMLWLSEKDSQKVAFRYKGLRKEKKVILDLFEPKSDDQVQNTIVNRFTATCPSCGYTTPYESVGKQLREKRGGTREALMTAVILVKPDGTRKYRLPTTQDLEAAEKARSRLERLSKKHSGPLSFVPDEPTPIARGPGASRAFSVRRYGMTNWRDAFTDRQALSLALILETINLAYDEMIRNSKDKDLAQAVATCLSVAVSGTLVPYSSALSIYLAKCMETAFKPGNALPMRPEFAEANPLMPKLVGGLEYAVNQIVNVIEHEGSQGLKQGAVYQGRASKIPLPDQSAALLVTDPPYYDAIPYAALSDLCYVWLKRGLWRLYPDLLSGELTPKDDECILDPGPSEDDGINKDQAYFEDCIKRALIECKRVLRPNGVLVVFFAHKDTAGWEALLGGLIGAGWTVTASWPIETEHRARMRALNSAVLASSVS